MFFKKSKLQMFKKAELKNHATLMEIYSNATFQEKSELKESGYLDEKFLSDCTKEELISIAKEDLVSDDILLTVCKSKISITDLFDIKELAPKTLLKFGTNKEIYQHMNLLLHEEDSLTNFELKYEFTNKIKMTFHRKDYYCASSKSCISFEYNSDVYFINQSDVLSVALQDYKILINGVPSPFQFEKNEDLSGLMSILFYLNKGGVENKKKLREFLMTKQDGQKEQSDIRLNEESLNPWLAGGIGFLLGVSIAD